MKQSDRDKTVHILFDIGLIGKAVDGVLEIIGGVVLFFVNPDQMNDEDFHPARTKRGSA